MRLVVVTALKSFDAFREGDTTAVYMTPGVASLIVNDYLRLIWDPAWEESWEATDGDSADLPGSSDESGPGDGHQAGEAGLAGD
jgi:hypothetical protein